MKKYTFDQLQKMDSSKLGNINYELDRIMDLLNIEFSGYIKDLSKKVDESETEDECRFYFINLIYNKQPEVEECLKEFFTNKDSEEALAILEKIAK